MKLYIIRALLLFLLIICACTDIHDKLSNNYHSWIIRTINYENSKNLIFEFNGNSVRINREKECVIPILNKEKFENCDAKCDFYKKDNKQYIYFYNTENWYFRDTFEILIVDKDNIEFVNAKKRVKLINAFVGWDSDNYQKGIE